MRMLGIAALAALLAQDPAPFEEGFSGPLSPGWTWVREEAAAWKLEGGALRIKALPGKIWYKTKTARNLLLHKIPGTGTADAPLVLEVTVDSAPETNAEQCGLFFYLDDNNYVKIIREHVKGKTHLLLVSEQKGIPQPQDPKEEASSPVRLRLTWTGTKVSGSYRTSGDWIPVGDADVPASPSAAAPSAGLACHGGAADADRWASFTQFRIAKAPR